MSSASHPIRHEIWLATRDSLPIWIGVLPFGLVFGLLGQQTELGVAGTMAMSSFVFAGSAQFISLGLLQAATAYPSIVLTTLVVNLRHLLYGASVAPHLQNLSPAWQRFLAFGLTDESYAITITRITRSGWSEHRHWYLLAANANMFICWQISTALGVLLSGWIGDPAALGLDFALSATLLGLLIPHVKDKAALVAVVVAAGVSLLTHSMPGQLGLLVAAVAAATAGYLWDRLTRGPKSTQGAPQP